MPRIPVRGRAAVPAAALIALTTLLAACSAGGPAGAPASTATAAPPAPSPTAAAASSTVPRTVATDRVWLIDGTTFRSVGADGSDPRDELTVPDVATNLAFSPDGNRLAYQHGPDGAMAIGVRDLDTGRTIDLKAPWTVYHEPVSWSPDGTHLAFVGAERAGGPDRIFTIPTDGSAPFSTVGDDALPPSMAAYRATFSPDGSLIAYLTGPAGRSWDESFGDVAVIRPDLTGSRIVAHDAWIPGLSWAPDASRQLLLYRTGEGPAIVDVAAGGTPTLVGPGFWGAWSPDASRIAYWHDGPNVVRTADVLAGHPTPVRVFASFTDSCDGHESLRGAAICSPITWSPDGSRLLGVDITGSDLLVAAADGMGTPQAITAAGQDGRQANVAWPVVR